MDNPKNVSFSFLKVKKKNIVNTNQENEASEAQDDNKDFVTAVEDRNIKGYCSNWVCWAIIWLIIQSSFSLWAGSGSWATFILCSYFKMIYISIQIYSSFSD